MLKEKKSKTGVTAASLFARVRKGRFGALPTTKVSGVGQRRVPLCWRDGLFVRGALSLLAPETSEASIKVLENKQGGTTLTYGAPLALRGASTRL